MSTNKERIIEIRKQIAELEKELITLNPYAGLKSLSIKAFGEEWSEPWILQHCPNFTRDNGRGHDFYSEKLGRVEVKSARLPLKQITFNQIHPYDCDYFLFVLYDTEEGGETIYLVSSKDIIDKTKFSLSIQHQRVENKEEANCFTMGMTKKNKAALENYKVANWEELDGKA